MALSAIADPSHISAWSEAEEGGSSAKGQSPQLDPIGGEGGRQALVRWTPSRPTSLGNHSGGGGVTVMGEAQPIVGGGVGR